MCSATLKTVVVEHLLNFGRAEIVVARELNAGVSERLDVRKSLGKAYLLDVATDGVELKTDLGLGIAAACGGANLGAATGGECKTAQRSCGTEKVSS